MVDERTVSTSRIYNPSRTLSRKTAEPILYLADKMSQSDHEAVPRGTRIVDTIADAVGHPTFRHQPWYREMTEAGALQRINSEISKRATMVVLSLVLKADSRRKDEEHAYFSWVREQLGAEPIHVPVDLEEHKRLALSYFKD